MYVNFPHKKKHFNFKCDSASLNWTNAKGPAYIKVITDEKRHTVEWERCKNHYDVWSAIGGVSVEWRSLVFPTFDERRGPSSFECPLISSLHPALCFMRSREPPQKTRTAINYALTHSDSPIIYTIVIYCFFFRFSLDCMGVFLWQVYFILNTQLLFILVDKST